MPTISIQRTLNKTFWLTFGSLLSAVGIYFFRFPENFNFGGVAGASVVLSKLLPLRPSTVNLILSLGLLLLSLLFLGKRFTVMTTYVTVVMSGAISFLDRFLPNPTPLTDEPLLNMVFAIALPGIGAALLFNMQASGGGTDIIAALLNRITGVQIGNAVLIADASIVLGSFFVFPIKTALFSTLGLVLRSFVVGNILESIKLNKYFNIICEDPEPICNYIMNTLGHTATVYRATGAFSHQKKHVILTVMGRHNAILLRRFIKEVEPSAFIMITNTSEIIGKGFIQD
ncbi:MAG: YitT family protein [Lachnospiraceae bacterium]|nr:YitT family protein [Lachnospiraceae bacterium]MDY5741708.1 YitT family protein [Lachnospiraceae bacterium]